MRVATFNIHRGTVGLKGPVDLPRLAEVCASFDAEVIALQEVDQRTWRSGRIDQAAALAEALGMTYVFAPASRFWGGWFGNTLLVRGEIVGSTVTRLPRVPDWHVWQEHRSLLQAEVVVAGQPWRVAVTHLAVQPRVNERQLGSALGMVGTGPATVVLGDLNNLREVVESYAVAAGLTYVEHGPTYPATKPQVTIDHVLHSPDLRVSGAEVRSTPMSDHAALVVDLARNP